MDDIKAKQQIVEKIKESTSILVTVSDDPSVDALSAAIGLTALLDKLEKHATAIYSGVTPPAIAFLEPEKILDDTTDSLRDFIIALDKSKADHLRLSKDGDMVKIFVTPYKTTITADDLEFSQGDYNVELVIALGVYDQDHLDKALESHGKILHDATVITITAGEQTSKLGGIDWHDDRASSLSEMLAGLGEALKEEKSKKLLDAQISTAFLTGIVAETDRFSNNLTTARAMTVASQLMAAGADQQLIAAKLAEVHEEPEAPEEEPEAPQDEPPKKPSSDDNLATLDLRDEPREEPEEDSQEAPQEDPKEDSENISSQPGETLEQLDKRVKAAEQAEAADAANEALQQTIEQAPGVELKQPEPTHESANTDASGAYAFDIPHDEPAELPFEEAPSITPIEPATPTETPAPVLPEPTPAFEQPAPQPIVTPHPMTVIQPLTEGIGPAQSARPLNEEPVLGGSLSATTEQAADDARRELENDQNKTILSHSYIQQSDGATPMSAANTGSSFVLGHDEPTLGDAQGNATGVAPADFGLPMPPAVPDFSMPPQTPSLDNYAYGAVTPPAQPVQPELLGDILNDQTPAASFENTAYAPQPEAPLAPPLPPTPPQAPSDPGQFRIPGQ